jgi:capping protein beta
MKNLKGIKGLLSADASEALMKRHLLPFTVSDPEDEDERPFLVCRYNTIGDKHRSPWTNHMHPKAAGDDPGEPDDLRLLESSVNDVWDAYKGLYYGREAVGSVYLVDTDKGAFQGLFGISKKGPTGSWNSLHIVHVDEPEEKTCNYRIESSVLLILEPETNGDESLHLDVSATVSKEVSKTCKVSPSMMAASHIENLGTLIEANEIDLRSSLERLYIPKTLEIMDGIQKKVEKRKPALNPLMGMIMDSSMLKKKMANEQG